jgi:hypothetical protein
VSDDTAVNGLQLPELLVEMVRAGKWHHPGDDVVARVVPCLGGPVAWLSTVEHIRAQSGSLADDPQLSARFHEVRSSSVGHPVELPWLDADNTVFIAVNREIGDDLGIALDYRTSPIDPRVVASEWLPANGCVWREVAPTFSAFVRALGLSGAAGAR